MFSPLSDPFNRTFSKTFEQDLPIVYLNPGLPKLNNKLMSADGVRGATLDFVGGIVDTLSFGVTNIKNYNDVRFVSFKPAFAEYYKYASMLMSYVYNLMGNAKTFEDAFVFSDEFKNKAGEYGLAYYCDKATSISESANNSYGQSTLANDANQKAAQIREFKQMSAMVGAGGLTELAEKVMELFTDVTSAIPIVGRIIAPLGKSLQGSQLYYPDIWQDSKYDRSYNVQFKLFSPYGDRESIFRYVYIPFLSLLALALPRQNGVYSYQEPFLVRASSPGHFECECGAITSIDFKRGGDDSLWTIEGFPNEIEITINIVDLYPTMTSTKKMREMKYNAGLTSFLECLSGLRFDQLAFMTRLNAKAGMYRDKIYEKITFKNLRNKISEDFLQGASNKIVNQWLK